MKKVLLSLLAVAALVLSCQNYDDEFDALNSKIASLESQITSLAELRTAVTGVQSSISALQTAVAAAQAAAEAAGDAAEAAGDANAEAAAANAESIGALATSVAAIAADLVDLQTAIDGATTEADLDALKAELNTTLAALQALIDSNSTSIAALVISNADLKNALETLGVDVTSILSANATFEGNLTITNASELAYAKSLGNKVATIKGDVYVKVDEYTHTSGGDGKGLKASEINSVLSQITYVIGNVKVDSDETLDLSALTGVTGDYMVIGHDASDDALLAVGADVFFDYDGPYTSKIQTAGNIFLNIYTEADATATTAAKLGTTAIDFLSITKASGVQSVGSSEISAHTSGGSLTFSSGDADQKISVSKSTTSVKIGQAPVVEVTSSTSATSTSLTTVELHYAADNSATNNTGRAALGSLSITGGEITSLTVKAVAIAGDVTIRTQLSTATTNSSVVNLSATKTISGKLDSNAGSNDLTALTSVRGITLSEQTSVSLPELTTSASVLNSAQNTLVGNGTISLVEATSFSAPKLAVVGAKAVAATASASAKSELRAGITAPKVVGTVSLPALELAGNLVFSAATAISAPLADVRSIDLSSSSSVELGSVSLDNVISGVAVDGSINTVVGDLSLIADFATITSLKLHNQKNHAFDLTALQTLEQSGTNASAGATTAVLSQTAFDTAVALTSLTFKAYTAPNTTAVMSFGLNANKNVALTSLTLGGALDYVMIKTTSLGTEAQAAHTALASITTSGTIRSLNVENNFDLTSLSLGHTEDLYATGASNDIELKIKNNKKLNSFTTAQTMAREIEIIDNSSLSSFDLSSINRLPSNVVTGGLAANQTNVEVKIYGNHLAPDHFDERSTADNAPGSATLAQTLGNWDGILGTYVAQSNAVPTSYGQASIKTLANLVSAIDTKFTPATGTPNDNNYPDLDWEIAYKYQSATTTIGDIVIAQAAVTLNSDGSTGTTAAAVNPVSSLDNATLLAEMKKF
jgi:hypothetical protein